MITQNELNTVLVEINRILSKLDERVTELEKPKPAVKKATTTTKK